MADSLSLLADRLDPPSVDVFGLLGYEPTPKQAEFHAATEFDVLYGGAAGGGKTRALLMEAVRACVRFPGIKVAAFRRSYPELEESLLDELAAINYAEAVGGGPQRYNGTKHDQRFANGSIIRFRYAETKKDATRRQGSEIQLLIIDERTQVPDEVTEYLTTRVRSGSGRIPALGVRSGTNPGGIGHSAVKTRYIEATEHGRLVIADPERPHRHIRFIPAKVAENPHLNVEYEADLNAIADAALRKALKDGDWDTFVGQFFTEWHRDRHVVRPFALPEAWFRYAGIDWGHRVPWAVEWGAQDPDGRLWVYREIYEARIGEAEQAKRVLAAEGALTDSGQLRRKPHETPRARLADPSMWNKLGDANPIATTYATQGCALVVADNDRIGGWQRVHTYLAEAPACPLHRAMGWETCPLLHVFDTCPNLIRTLPALPHDTVKVEDVDTDAEDHAPDALRYLLKFLPLPQVLREKRPVPTTPDEKFWAHIHAQGRQRRRGL